MTGLTPSKSKDGSKEYLAPTITAVDFFADGTMGTPRELSYGERDALPVVTRTGSQDTDEDKILDKAIRYYRVLNAILEGYGVDTERVVTDVPAPTAPAVPVHVAKAPTAPKVAAPKVTATVPTAPAVNGVADILAAF
jgi:hypothetical protein